MEAVLFATPSAKEPAVQDARSADRVLQAERAVQRRGAHSPGAGVGGERASCGSAADGHGGSPGTHHRLPADRDGRHASPTDGLGGG